MSKYSKTLIATSKKIDDKNLKTLLFDESSVALVICFVSPFLEFEAVCRKIRDFFPKDCVVVGTTTAGELCNIDNKDEFYLPANGSYDRIVITSFSSNLFKRVELFEIRLFGEDVKSDLSVISNQDRVGFIEKEFNSLKLNEPVNFERDFIYTLIDGMSNSEGFFIDAYYRSQKFPCKIVGGSSGVVDVKTQRALLFNGDRAVENRALILLLRVQNKISFEMFKTQNYSRGEALFSVLKSSFVNRYVETVLDKDGKSKNIIDFLTNYFSCKEEELESALREYSFGIVIGQNDYLRTIKKIDFKKRRIYFYSDIDFGDTIYIFKEIDFVKKTKEDLDSFLKMKPKPILAILNDCLVRRFSSESVKNRDAIFSDIEAVGFSAFGEIFGVHVNETLSAVFFFDEKIEHKSSKGDFVIYYTNYSKFFSQRLIKALQSKELIENYVALERTIKELTDSKKRLEKISQYKSNFLSNMSHEIRTPLNAILGFVEILKESAKDKKSAEYLDIISKNSSQLLMTINDILDLSKIERGKLSINPVDFSKDELKPIYELFRAQALQNRIDLTFEMVANVPEFLHGDILRIKQIITNLVSNAIKFTNSNKCVSIKIDYIDENLIIEVEDQGKGIKKENLDIIFKSFTQEDNSITKEYGGSGLGLSIVNSLVRMMNGKIEVESEVGVGTSFVVTLPLKSGKKTVHDIHNGCNGEFFGKKILVVEDNMSNQLFMRALLSSFKVDLDVASDGLEAIEKFKLNKYDLILMDVNMPNMDGVEATKNILEIEDELGQSHTPIVALTANALTGDKERFLRAGMDGYLTKPLRKSELHKVFKKFFG